MLYVRESSFLHPTFSLLHGVVVTPRCYAELKPDPSVDFSIFRITAAFRSLATVSGFVCSAAAICWREFLPFSIRSKTPSWTQANRTLDWKNPSASDKTWIWSRPAEVAVRKEESSAIFAIRFSLTNRAQWSRFRSPSLPGIAATRANRTTDLHAQDRWLQRASIHSRKLAVDSLIYLTQES